MDITQTSVFQDLNIGNRNAAAPQNKSDQLGQADFLKLMITQFRNQDPMKPMENGEFVAQMASFGTVSGIQDLQNSLSDLASSLQSDQGLQAASLIGRSVQVPDDTISLEKGGSVNGAIQLPASVSDVKVTIKDAAGAVVNQIKYGPRHAGDLAFSWDGRTSGGEIAPEGHYTIEAEATSDYTSSAVQTYINHKVSSVSMGSGTSQSMILNLENGEKVKFSQVRQIM